MAQTVGDGGGPGFIPKPAAPVRKRRSYVGVSGNAHVGPVWNAPVTKPGSSGAPGRAKAKKK